MDYLYQFATHFNLLKKRAENRMLLRLGSKEACEKIVRAKLAEVTAVLDGTEVDVAFLVAGSIIAHIISPER